MLEIDNSGETTLYNLLHSIYVLLDFGDRAVLKSFKFNPTEFRLLALVNAEEGQRLIDISNALLRSKSQITRIVADLEKRGLLIRMDDDSDGRAWKVMLTDQGRSTYQLVETEFANSLEDRFENMDRGEADALSKMLDDLRQGMVLHYDLEFTPIGRRNLEKNTQNKLVSQSTK